MIEQETRGDGQKNERTGKFTPNICTRWEVRKGPEGGARRVHAACVSGKSLYGAMNSYFEYFTLYEIKWE